MPYEQPDEEQAEQELRELEVLINQVSTKLHRIHNLNLSTHHQQVLQGHKVDLYNCSISW